MADTRTIEVPVKLKAEFQNINKDLQKVLKNIQDGLADVDPASGLAKSLTKAYAEIEKQLGKSSGLLDKEFFSEADMSKVTKAWDKVSDVLSSINSQTSRASLGTLGVDIEGLAEAKQQLQDIIKLRQAFLGRPVSADITPDALTLANKHAGKSGFKETANYGKNLINMTTATATLTAQLETLEKQAQDTQEALDQATQSHAAAQDGLNIAQGLQKTKGNFYNTQYGNVASTFAKAGAAANGNSPQNVIDAYKKTVASLISNGEGGFTENGELIARMVRDWFDLDIDFSKEASEIVADLQNGLEDALRKDSKNWGKRGKLSGKALQGAFTPFTQKAGKDNFAASKTSQELAEVVAKAQEEVNKTKAVIDDTGDGSLKATKAALDTQITEAKTVIKEIQASIEELKALRQERNTEAGIQFDSQQQQAQERVNRLTQQARESTRVSEEVRKGQSYVQSGTTSGDEYKTDRIANEQAQKNAKAAQEAANRDNEQFRQRLTQSIHQWTSVQQIVNKIKDGFRQAIQDIKGLDKAMTNIAVVTDMSVSDLWGKIDEYMSIAQQYGVTTQGVYEVSQLYYQQGLGTDEVMAATTETLKMARIAGMEYAEAADAMTVAIRAFKMEMSDAEHVTDVYSKVAAVTASDTEELAVAMSKTASSAESVGSSFENTTAMLAVMIETTRESAQNLGSALKSIISRYGEMKVGVTVDSEGETIDYNKVDTALKSVGISIKDAQGQFRDFDDVIFELSEKWDSLDKNTQRYIATIMAGNRQQSRFIALVDNWERLDEVAGAAQDSEDAGLLQYAKTLDSLESKVNNIKTSFQQFYMSVFNGPVVGAALEFLNNLIKGFNKISKLTTIFNAVSIISGIRIIGELVVNTFSGAFKNISTAWKTTLKEMRLGAVKEARATGRDYQNNVEAGMKEADDPDIGNNAAVTKTGRRNALISAGLSAAGMGLSAWGSSAAASNQTTGALLSGAGNGLSAAGLVMSLGAAIPGIGWAAAAVGGITAVVSAITSMPSALEKAQEDLVKAEEKAEKSNIERAEKKNEYETLKRETANLRELEKARFDSAEAQQEWVNANNALFEQFPYLAATFDEVGNATIDLESAEQALAIARKASLSATIKAAEDEKDRAKNDLNVAKEKQKENYDKIATGQKFKLESGKTYKAPALISGVGAYSANFYQWLLSPKRAEQVELLKQTGVLSEKVAKSGQVSYELSNDSSIFSTFLFNFLDQLNAEQHSEWLATFNGLTQEETVSKLISEGASKFTNSEGNQIYKTTQDFLAAWLHRGAAFTSLNEQQQEYIEYIIATINSSTQEIEGLENKITGADKTLLASKTAEQLHLKEERDDKDYDETYGKIAGWNNYVARYVKEAQAAVEEPFDDQRIGEQVEAAVGQWDDLENKLNQSSKLEDYNSLVESFEKGNISIVDYINSLEDLFNETIPDAVQNTQEWAKAEVNKNIKNLAQGLVNKAGWSKGGREDWESETDTLSNTEEWLQSIPENLHQNIVDYVNYVNELVTNAKIEDSQADSMVEAYTGLYDAINSEELNLTSEQKAKAFSILDTADLTSLGGIYDAQNAINKAGISLDKNAWDNILSQVLINLVTETQTLQQKVINAIDSDVKLLKQAYDGVDTAAEAAKLASKLGVTLADFESVDGKMRLKKDINLAKKREEELKEYKDKIYGTEIDSNQNGIIDASEKSAWKAGQSAYGAEYRNAQTEGLNKESEIYKKYQSDYEAWQQLEGNANKSLADYIEYRRNSELEAIDGLFADFWEQQEKLIKKQSIIDDFYNTNGKENGEAERKKLSAQKSLASGGQGLSGDTIYDILDAYGISHDQWAQHFTKNADGTFDIITNSGLFNQLDQATKNAIIDKVAANVDSAEQGLLKLGETAATGKKLDASEIRSLLGAEFDGLSNNTANLLYKQYQLYLQGGVTEGTLIANFAKAIREDDSSKNWGTALSEAKEIYSNIQAQLTDAVKTNLSKQLELQAKVLQGTATETEKEALKEASIDISGLESKTNKAIVKWINSYINNTDLSFDNKAKYIKTAFSTALTNKFGEDIGTLGETAVKGVFGTQDAASDFISKYYTILGQTIDENTADSLVSSWFTRDDSGQYRLNKTIQSLRDELSKIQGSANQEEIDNLEAQLTYYENLQELQRKESLTSSLKSLATSSDNITASQMMSLIQGQGKTVSISEAETYAKDLQNLNPIERLKELVKILKQEDIPVDTDTYQNLVKETIASVMNSASTSISKLGSGMSWNDAFSLTEEIEGLNFSDFEVIGDQYFINNTEKAVKYYQEQVSAAFDEQAKMIEGAADVPIELLQSGNLGDQADLPIADLSGQYEKAQALMQSEYFDETHYKQWLSQAGNKSKNFGQYWQEYINSLDEAAQAAIEAWKKEADRQKSIAQYAAKWGETLEDKGIDKTKVEGLNLLKSKGYKGYTEQDMATLQAGGLIKTDEDSLKRIQEQIDAETGTFYLTENDLQPLTAATRNALKLTLDQEVQSAKTTAENLATKMANGTAKFSDYEALFKESITPENFDIIEPLLKQYVEDQSNATDVKNALKRAYPDKEEEDIDAILANWVAFYNDAKHETARSIFNTKIEALSSGYLSEASKEALKKGGATDFVTKFADLAGKAADEIFDTVYKEYEKAYDDGVIKRDEYRTGIAEAASKAFTAKVEAEKPSLYLDDATKEIAGGDALYDANALGSLYAAIADKQKAAKATVDDFDTFYEKYVTGITEAGEAILNVKALKGANLISDRRYKEFSSALMDNLFSSAEEIITQMEAGDTEGLGLQIQQMFDALGMSLSDQDVKAILDGGQEVLLNRLIFEINRAGLDTTEVQSRLEELQALILDTIVESISSGMSALGEGIEGTLSEASFLDLQKRYGFKDSSFRTSRGVQLSAQNLQDVITGLYGDAKANGRTAGFGKQLLEVLNTEGSGFEGYKDIEEAIADANKQIAEGVDGAKEYAEALKLARDAAYEMADAAEIAFMEQDPYDGHADTFDNFIKHVDLAKEALATFGKGGKIAHTDLAMMFDVIKNGSQESINKFVSTFKAAGDNMESILASAHAFMDTTGKIDIGKWALKMGIDVKTATTAMAEGMTDSLRATAQSQLDYLSGLEVMLEAMVALEEIGSIELGMEFNTGLQDANGELIIIKQLSQVYDVWDQLQQNTKEAIQIQIKTVLQSEQYSAKLSSFMKGFGLEGTDFFTAFFGKTIDSDMEVQLADAFGSLIERIPNMTSGQVETVMQNLNSVLQDSIIRDKDGKFVEFKEGYIKSLLQLFSTWDLADIPESLATELSEKLAENNGIISIPVKNEIGISIQSAEDGKGFNIVGADGKALTELSDTQIKAIKETLATQFGMVVEDIKIDAATGSVSFYGEAAQTETEALKTDFDSLSEAATSVSEAITTLDNLLTNFQVSDAFREFVTLMTQLVTGSAGVTKMVEGTQNAANMEEVAGEGEGDSENERTITLNIDITAAELAFKTIEEYYTKLAELVSTPVSVNLNSVTATTSQALTNQGGNVPPATNPGGGVVSPLTTHTVQIVWDITEPDFDSIQAPTLDFKWMKKSPPTPSYNPTINYKWGSATNKITYSGAAIEVPIKLVEQTDQQAWTGTMNNITGAAFADGSIGRLYSGASFASKTLVGELGPELAVYDGQYHLLGQHGAEFVNLPKDAIVFNHKQTEGIAKGQFNIRGKAMADGNVSGPAMAGGGASAALAAVQRAKSLWQNLLNKLTAAELAGGSNGGGGGGNTLKGIKEELQEWYNLSRKIADIEQEINNILAERENIPREDGNAYLRSLREQQKLLQEQAATQEILLNYQKLQLERQAENINNNAIWSQFLTVDSNGLLQYTKGNELFGGKGALEVLSDLNEMSGAEQLEFLESLGYTAYDQDGKALEGTELIKKFFEELQYQIDEYDSLYDTIHSTSEELQKLQTEINKINDEITQNQMDLEEDIYNILVDAWEEEIEALEEQKELIEEANDAYVKGLNEALSAEREMYSEEQSIANREQLQRQLSLLRRSGGSASEIANLEKQLDSMLQEEYFRNQEKMIQSIEDANKEQVQQLEHQIRLQEEALEFEKEHGILWTKVYEIMAGSKDEILAFMQNNYPGFFSQSVLEQRKMLTDWAHEIGIYTENRTFEEHKTYAQSNIWNTGAIWAQGNMGGYQSMFNALTPEQQAAAREQFNTTYASARLAGDDHETAMRKANASLTKYLTASKEQQEAEKNKEPNTDKVTNPGPSTPPASTPTYSTVSISVSANPSAGGSPTVSKTKANAGDTITVYPKPKEGYAFSHITVGGNQKSGTTFKVTGQISSVKVVVYYTETSKVEEEAKTGDAGTSSLTDKGISKNVSTKAYSSGGLVDYTGPAIVHGSPSKPEAFLNAKQTAMISEAVKFAGDGGALDGIKATLNALNASIKSIVNNNRNEISSFTVAPGAVTIQVAELSDSYDVEELSRDVMNRMVAIASKSTNRGVNRR